MSSIAPDYLSHETLAAIAPIDLRARMIVEGLMIGQHRSPYQGFSVEFAQHRQYIAGDDTRFLDWKVFGRSDKLYIKQYQKETNLDLVIMVDASGSMGYSSLRYDDRGARWRKYDCAASLAAALAYLALQQQDRVGLVMFSDHMQAVTRMSNARDHWRTIIEMLSTERVDEDRDALIAGGETQRTTDLARLFDQMTAKLARRSLLVLISDLFDTTEAFERGLALLKHRRHDLMVLQTLDHAELTFPFRSPTDFIGLENEGKLGLDPAALRQAYLDSLNAHLQKVEDLTRQFGFDYLLVDSSQSLGAALGHFLARRAAVAARKVVK